MSGDVERRLLVWLVTLVRVTTLRNYSDKEISWSPPPPPSLYYLLQILHLPRIRRECAPEKDLHKQKDSKCAISRRISFICFSSGVEEKGEISLFHGDEAIEVEFS